MKKLAIILALVLGAQAPTMAQNGPQADGTPSIDLTLYEVRQAADGTFSLKPVRILITGASVKPPVDPPVDPPALNWTTAATEAIALVPEYADRDKHIKALAFSLNMLGSTIGTSSKPVGETVGMIKAFAKAVPGGDADKWGPFWDKLDPLLNAAKSNAALGAGLIAIKDVLEGQLSQSDLDGGEMYGTFPTYGLQEDGASWLDLIIKLLPIILEIIQNLRS